MYNNPAVMGVGPVLSESDRADPRSLLPKLGNNTGNLVFSDAVFRLFEGTERRIGYRANVSQLVDRDHLIIAAANWLNPRSDFGFLADLIEEIDLPTFVLGLGAQSPHSATKPELKEGTVRFLRAASERCTTISARGAYTAEVLKAYGVDNVRVTGCPSLLLCGPEGPNIRTGQLADEQTVIHSTRHLFQRTDPLGKFLFEQAFRRRLPLILQSELADMIAKVEGIETEQVSAPLASSYGTSDMAEIADYLNRFAHFFSEVSDWVSFLQSKSFCIGSRIHGTVVAILAGTPAILLTHDTRTKELAESMRIPHVDGSEVDLREDLDLPSLYSTAVNWNWREQHRLYRAQFNEFFRENGLSPATPVRTQ